MVPFLRRKPANGLALILLLALGLACALWQGGDRGRPYGRLIGLVRVAPSLDRELLWHVCVDDEREWHEFCRRVGPRPLMDAYAVLLDELRSRPFEKFVTDRPRLEAGLLRVSEAISREFGYVTPVRYIVSNMRRSDREDYALFNTMSVFKDCLANQELTTQGRLNALDSVASRFRSLDALPGVLSANMEAAQIELANGNWGRFRSRIETARELARELEDDYIHCQILGQLGVMYSEAGYEDSSRAAYSAGLALAMRHQFSDQAARLMMFEAQRAISEGHVALAADRLVEASDLVDQQGGSSSRVRLALRRAMFFADLQCWDLVERTLRRLPVLMRVPPLKFTALEAAKHLFDSDLLRARAAFARGHLEAGQQYLRPWLRNMPVGFRRVGLAQLYDAWSEGAVRAGEWDEAARICALGAAHCEGAHVSETLLPLMVRRARALEAMGRLTEARQAAVDAGRQAREAGKSQNLAWETALTVLDARLRFHAGDLAGGRARLRAAVARVQRQELDAWRSYSPGPEDRTGLSLREAVHELAGLSPAAGYGFEMQWRSLPRRTWDHRVDPFAEAHFAGSGTHLVYYFTRRGLLRWTASSRGVVLDTLALPPEACLSDVRQAVMLLRTETPVPGRWLGPRSERVLRRLAVHVLPAGLSSGALDRSTLEVSPDGPLLALPFEALPIAGPEGDVPLAWVADVGYQSGWRSANSRPAGAAVVVANPAIPPALCRRYAWSGTLQGTDAEFQIARGRWPDATVLRGKDATRSQFLRVAEHASYLYMAAHHVRDPGAPFLGFIPLAAEADGDAGAPLLEATDIRALDLSECRLAVLASCASGAPYRVSEQPGPSLGDAFLDAGAHVVVRSFWEVGDEETRAFMERFMKEDARPGQTTLHALANARRAAMRGPDGAPPRVWAAWSVAESWDPRDAARERSAPRVATLAAR